METFSRCLPSSPPFKFPSKTLISIPKSHLPFPNYLPITTSKPLFSNPLPNTETLTPSRAPTTTLIPTNALCFLHPRQFFNKNPFPLLFPGFSFPLSCFASEIGVDLPSEQVSDKISLESVLVSIDNFFNRYPFFVATVAFIWLVAIPLAEEYLQKYKYASAINAFKKLRDDPNCQLLDIRDGKSLAYLGSPNLKMLSKSAVQVGFREGEEEGFVNRVLEKLGNPADTTVCVVDNFDGNSIKVAELLVKNGFKEAYAIRGGIRGKKGWQEIQETLLPPSMRVYPKKKGKKLKHFDKNGGMSLQDNAMDATPLTAGSKIKNAKSSSDSLGVQSKDRSRPLSPYPNYPDLRPPSSPTPAKPN